MKLRQVVEKGFHMSTANPGSGSREGGTICPHLRLSGPDLWKPWRKNCCVNICTAKARAVRMAVPPIMHHLACDIFQFKWKKREQVLSSRKKKFLQGNWQIFKAPETWEWVETCEWVWTKYLHSLRNNIWNKVVDSCCWHLSRRIQRGISLLY